METTPSTTPLGTYDVPNIRGRIDAVNRRFEAAFSDGDPATVAREAYTRGARILPPGASMIQGREAIASFWTTAAQKMGVTRVQLSTVDLAPFTDGAYEIGRVTLTHADGAQATGKYVVIWRQEDGRWRMDVDIWNMDA